MIQIQFPQLLKRKAAVSGKLYGVARKLAATHLDERLSHQRQVAFMEQFKFLTITKVAGKETEGNRFSHHLVRITFGCVHE